MATRLRDRIAALEAAGTPVIAGDAVLLSDEQLWEVIRRGLPPGSSTPDPVTASDGDIDRFLLDMAADKRV